MTKAIRNFAILGLVISLMAACSNGQISIDGGKPDEYSVVARSGLVIPEAGTGLREPAAAGSEIKDADAAQRLAKRALLGLDPADGARHR